MRQAAQRHQLGTGREGPGTGKGEGLRRQPFDAVGGKREGFVRLGLDLLDPAGDFAAKGPRCRRVDGPPRARDGDLVALDRPADEAEAVQLADEIAFDRHFAAAVHRRQQFTPILHPPDECGGTPVDEALRETLVQRVRELVLDASGPLLPVAGVVEPVSVMGDVGPGADVGDALYQRLDVAVGAVEAGDLAGDPVGGQASRIVGEVAIDLTQQARVTLAHHLAEIGDLAHRPQQPHGLGPLRAFDDIGLARERGQHQLVVGFSGADEPGLLGRPRETGPQRRERDETQIVIAPEQRLQRIEAVVFDALGDFSVQRPDVGGGAKGSVVHVAPGAAGDLRQLGGGQAPQIAPVELPRGGEGDVVDVHVEAHSDRIGGDQVVDLAGLIHRHLGIAGSGAEGAEHHRGAAPLAADQLGQRIDVCGGEGDDGGTWRQARDLSRTTVGEGREPRTALEFGFRNQPADRPPRRLGAHEHGLARAAGMQQAVGEQMAAVGIGAHLDFVDADEGDAARHRHGFDSAEEVAGVGWENLFLAGNQCHLPRSLDPHRAVVILARQQAQREADHARLVTEQALHGEVGLTGVGWPEDGDDARPAIARGSVEVHVQNIAILGPMRKAPEQGRIVLFQPRPPAAFAAALDHGHEGDGQLGLADDGAVGLFDAANQRLGFVAASDGNDHAPTTLELVDQRLGDRRRRSGHHDRVERCLLGPALIAVTVHHLDVGVSQRLEAVARVLGQFGDDFDGIHPSRNFGQHRRLIAAASADLEHPVVGFEVEEIGHHRDDIGLRDGLFVADAERPIDVSRAALPFRNELVARDARHRRHHPLREPVPAGPRPGFTRFGLDLAEKPLVGLGKPVVGHKAHSPPLPTSLLCRGRTEAVKGGRGCANDDSGTYLGAQNKGTRGSGEFDAIMTQETFTFQTEVSKLLDIVAHSLYTHKEIFLRELISNASDACDRLRYAAITEPALTEGDPEFKIRLSADKDKRTLTVADNGIGMNHDDLVETLGTIARSGTQAFVNALTGDAKKDMALIGQFGVGFYSSFMVADSVEVVTRKAGEDKAWGWVSDGKGSFTIEDAERDVRGTTVTLHLAKDENEFLEPHRLRRIVNTYSDHIGIPVVLKDGDTEDTVNTASALWTRPKKDITAEQYKEFYHHAGHAFDDPWLTLHNAVEGVVSYTNLLFVPSSPPFDLFHPDRKGHVKLYVKRVFITDDCEGLLPSYLRFLKGVVDSEDLPLNISRETFQHDPRLAKIRAGLVKRVLGELGKNADKKPEEYETFWANFGAVLKEGIYEDFENRDKVLGLARFRSTGVDGLTSLDGYVERMKEGQDAIYTISGEDAAALARSPQLEGFKAKGVEVLLLTDPIDEFWIPAVRTYKEKPFKSAAAAGADLGAIADSEQGEKGGAKEAETTNVDALVANLKVTLGESVKDVRASERLTDSAVCLVADEGDMDMYLERMLRQHRQLDTPTPRILEINARHPLIRRLAEMASGGDGQRSVLEDAAHLLLDQARIIEGETVPDPVAFATRLSSVMEKGLAA